MSLKAFQDILMRVYTADRFRREFLREPDAVLAGFKLSSKEIGALRSIRTAELEGFCACLAIKRWGRLRAYFPKTASLIGRGFSSLLLEFSGRHADVKDWPSRIVCFYRLLQSQIRRADSPPGIKGLAKAEYAAAMRRVRHGASR